VDWFRNLAEEMVGMEAGYLPLIIEDQEGKAISGFPSLVEFGHGRLHK
jgi:hypothetical protein